MNRIRLEAGQYRATEKLTVALCRGPEARETTQYPAGAVFDVSRHVNGFFAAAIYYPELGESEPVFEKITS